MAKVYGQTYSEEKIVLKYLPNAILITIIALESF